MRNFKEIADKCSAGELKGTFVLASGKLVSSDNLTREPDSSRCVYKYQMYVNGVRYFYTIHGTLFSIRNSALDIINFIPDNMQEQIKIDIPEGKVPVMEQTENGVVITWKEKELTYSEIYESLWKSGKVIHPITNTGENKVNDSFITKVNVLRKLTNIRNYFGKSTGNFGYIIIQSGVVQVATSYDNLPIFATKEHAEQAIKILGDELKYLFEPW